MQPSWLLLAKTGAHACWMKRIDNGVSETAGKSLILETVERDLLQQETVIARFKADQDEARCGPMNKAFDVGSTTSLGCFGSAFLKNTLTVKDAATFRRLTGVTRS